MRPSGAPFYQTPPKIVKLINLYQGTGPKLLKSYSNFATPINLTLDKVVMMLNFLPFFFFYSERPLTSTWFL